MHPLNTIAAGLLILCVVLVVSAGSAYGQEAETYQGMTLEEARREAERLGIDLTNPAAAIERARNMGISDARIQQILQAYQDSAETQVDNSQRGVSRTQTQDPALTLSAEKALSEARRFGIDLSDPERALQQARDAGVSEARVRAWLFAVRGEKAAEDEGRPALPSPRLLRLPEVSPASVDVTEGDEVVSVTVTFRAPDGGIWSGLNVQPGQESSGRSEMDIPGNTRSRSGEGSAEWDLAAEIDSQETITALPENVNLYFVSASEEDTLHARRVQQVISGTAGDMWMGSVLIPSSTTSGVWTLVVETEGVDGFATGRLDPAGFLEIEGLAVKQLTHFGYDTFERSETDADIQLAGPVSDGYVVGPNDELRLTVWGGAEFQYDLPVDPEGRIFVPNTGQLTVAGKRLDELRADVRNWLSRRYAGLTDQPPSVFMDLTVTRMKPLRVFVLGEVEEPGSYTVPSGSSVFDALYEVGGPLTRGSLRDVRIGRGDRVAEVDLYDYLVQGYVETPVQLQTGDHVFIPPRGITVTIEGAVRRPAIYEMKSNETVKDLVAFAGGLTAEAYSKQFQIERILPIHERRNPSEARTVIDFSLEAVLTGRESVSLRDGDHVEIFSIPEAHNAAARRTVPAVKVAGAVYKPGRYELGRTVRTIRDLLESADGLTGDAFLRSAELVRVQPDLQSEIVAIDLEKVLADVPTHNLVLRPQDSLFVYSLQNMREERTVEITGQIRNPGEYRYYEGMTVGDLLAQGDGLYDPEFRKDVFLARADIFRRSTDGASERIIPFDLAEALDGESAGEVRLMPEDVVRVYPADVNAVRERFVVISGAVKEPGTFRYREGMTVEDLVLQAGGFREDALRDEVQITRAETEDAGKVAQLSVPFNTSAAFAASSTGDAGRLFASNDTLSLTASEEGFHLDHRDRVYVRAIPNFYEDQRTVKVHGEVTFPGEYTLVNTNETISSVIRRAGGVLPSGYSEGTQMFRDGERVVVEMDEALRGGTDLILRNGDEIVVPARPNTVAVLGNVGQETHIKYVPGKRVSYYLNRAGGLRRGTQALLLTQPTGATYKLRGRWILPRENPVVEDGAVIRATIEPYAELAGQEGFDWSTTIKDVVAVASSALTIVLLYQRVK